MARNELKTKIDQLDIALSWGTCNLCHFVMDPEAPLKLDINFTMKFNTKSYEMLSISVLSMKNSSRCFNKPYIKADIFFFRKNKGHKIKTSK
jgi:hypothetical protein